MADDNVTLHDYASEKIQNLLYNIRYIKQEIQRHGDEIQRHGDDLELQNPVMNICEEEKIMRTTVDGWNTVILVWQSKVIAWLLVSLLSKRSDTSIQKGKNFVQSIYPAIIARYHTELRENGIIQFLRDWTQVDQESLTKLYEPMFNGYSIDQSPSNNEEKVTPPGVRF